MIEFTASRIVLCICGAVLLSTAAGIMGSYQNGAEYGMEENLAEDIAAMLDKFWDSETQEMTLEGSRILPSPGHTLRVESHMVTLEKDGRAHSAPTRCGTEFELGYGGTVTVEKFGLRRPRLYGAGYPRKYPSLSRCYRCRRMPWRSRRCRARHRTDAHNASPSVS